MNMYINIYIYKHMSVDPFSNLEKDITLINTY